MPAFLTARAGARLVPITPLAKDRLEGWLHGRPEAEAAWVRATGFKAEPGAICLLAGEGGSLARVLAGIDPEDDLWSYAGLPAKLPARESTRGSEAAPGGRYTIDAELGAEAATRAALGWALGTYAFTRYRKAERTFAALAWPKAADKGTVRRTAEAIFLVRDLINTPAGDMGPAELAAAAKVLARRHKAKCAVIVGDALLRKNYPAIHAVGRASDRAPRLIDLRWGGTGPRVTLVGKGVCFDSGGLDLKSAALLSAFAPSTMNSRGSVGSSPLARRLSSKAWTTPRAVIASATSIQPDVIH